MKFEDCFGCKYFKKYSKDKCTHSWKEYCNSGELWTPLAYYSFGKLSMNRGAVYKK